MGCEEDIVSEDPEVAVGCLIEAYVQDRANERCSAQWLIETALLRKFVILDRWPTGARKEGQEHYPPLVKAYKTIQHFNQLESVYSVIDLEGDS
jgi:hypothetical protein